MIDYHIHSDISADCGATMRQMANAARRLGLKEICFTEHLDLDFPADIDFNFDFDVFDRSIDAVRKEFPELRIAKGVEAGLDMRTRDALSALLSKTELDFVIGSVHVVLGRDPYEKEFWEAYERRHIFEAYLHACEQCAGQCGFYDVFGHLGYISKFCPYPDSLLRLCDFPDAVDTILETLVRNGKGLEVNTNGLYMTPSVMPELPIVERFLELGGEIVTIGSDAHYQNVVGHAVANTLDALKGIGLKYICAFDKQQPRFIPIP